MTNFNKTQFNPTDWQAYASAASTRSKSATFTHDKIYTTRDARTSLNPKDITVRESRDSDVCPQSTAIIIAFDETGSMGNIPYEFQKSGLGTLFLSIYDRKPVTDPQVLCAAVGDAITDTAPFQPTQFEVSCNTITDQLVKFYLEGCGGGNGGESYLLTHYFAALKTSIDCFEKRGVKGKLFTIGDEHPHSTLTRQQIQTVFGDEAERDLTSNELVAMASKQWDLYHVAIMEGGGNGGADPHGIGDWNELLGEGHVIQLSDHTKLSEVVVSALQIAAGTPRDAVVSSWSGDTSVVVARAISQALAASHGVGPGGVVRL